MSPRSIVAFVIALTAALLFAEPAAAWCLYRLKPAGVAASSTAPGTSAEALGDGNATTAWRPEAGDTAPWVEFRFAEPVQPGFIMIADEAAGGIGLVKAISVTTDSGATHAFSVPEFAEVPAMPWTTGEAVTSVRVAITRCQGGTVGLTDLAVIGRRPGDASALTLANLAKCTLTLERDLVVPANRPATRPVEAEVFLPRDGFIPWSLQMGARDIAAGDRTVGAGKTFAVVEVADGAGALVLRCADGSTFGLFDESDGAPRSLMSTTRQFTVAELNDIFAGIVRISDAVGRETSAY
jgi:hypothetical protein